MAVNIEDIKRLKNLTGVGLTDAKAALEAASGDFDAALEEMRKKGMTKAEKRGEREARAGVVGTYNHDDRIGVLVEINCETDFVARNEIFTTLVKDVAMHVAASAPEYLDMEAIPADVQEEKKKEFAEKAKADGKPENMIDNIVDGMLKKYFAERCLLEQPFVKNPDITVGDLVKEHNAKLGENIVVRQFSRIALGEVNQMRDTRPQILETVGWPAERVAAVAGLGAAGLSVLAVGAAKASEILTDFEGGDTVIDVSCKVALTGLVANAAFKRIGQYRQTVRDRHYD